MSGTAAAEAEEQGSPCPLIRDVQLFLDGRDVQKLATERQFVEACRYYSRNEEQEKPAMAKLHGKDGDVKVDAKTAAAPCQLPVFYLLFQSVRLDLAIFRRRIATLSQQAR